MIEYCTVEVETTDTGIKATIVDLQTIGIHNSERSFTNPFPNDLEVIKYMSGFGWEHYASLPKILTLGKILTHWTLYFKRASYEHDV